MKTLLALVLLLPAVARADEIVDLQWSICDVSPKVVLHKLNSDDADKKKDGDITYYDTARGDYSLLGLSFRTKEKKGDLETSVKVRFQRETANVPANTDCSWDRYGNSETYTCEQDDDLAKNTVWTAREESFVEHYDHVDFAEMQSFGPFKNPKWNLKLAGYDGVFDNVSTDNNMDLMELSVKVPKDQDEEVYQVVSKVLNDANVGLCPIQEGKTPRYFRALGFYGNVNGVSSGRKRL